MVHEPQHRLLETASLADTRGTPAGSAAAPHSVCRQQLGVCEGNALYSITTASSAPRSLASGSNTLRTTQLPSSQELDGKSTAWPINKQSVCYGSPDLPPERQLSAMPAETDSSVKYYRGFNATKVGHCPLP